MICDVCRLSYFLKPLKYKIIKSLSSCRSLFLLSSDRTISPHQSIAEHFHIERYRMPQAKAFFDCRSEITVGRVRHYWDTLIPGLEEQEHSWFHAAPTGLGRVVHRSPSQCTYLCVRQWVNFLRGPTCLFEATVASQRKQTVAQNTKRNRGVLFSFFVIQLDVGRSDSSVWSSSHAPGLERYLEHYLYFEAGLK